MPGPLPSDINVRFDSKVIIDSAGCHLWQSARDQDGYGIFQVSGRVSRRAHRWAYERAHGPIAAGVVARHSCDTPACVNPEHIQLGTPRDNAADMLTRNRDGNRRGEGHYAAKLTWEAVRSIRSRYESGELLKTLASEFGISKSHASNIVTDRKWTK